MNQIVSKYRTAMRRKKRYVCVEIYCIDVAINNTCQLHKMCEGKDVMDVLTFRCSIACFFLKHYASLLSTGKQRKPKSRLMRLNMICMHTGLFNRIVKQIVPNAT